MQTFAQVLFALVATQTVVPQFDVATVKPSSLAGSREERTSEPAVTNSPSSLSMSNVSLASCIQWAWDVRFDQVSGPAWIREDRFDIRAKAAGPVSPDQLRSMLQSLLAERFGLLLHRESKLMPVYDLIALTGGPRLRTSKTEGPAEVRIIDGSFQFGRITMADLAEKLADIAVVDRPVIDKTGISGKFDVLLEGGARYVLEGDAASFFATLRPLGMKLESRRTAVETLVIDRANRPMPQ